MPAVARVGDGSSHGGVIIAPTSPNVFANGVSVARQGDLHSCPIQGHGVTPITATATQTKVNGQLVITSGAVAGCGAVIIGGSTDVNCS